MITLNTLSIDGFRQTKTFKTLKGARAAAVARVGQYPEIDSWMWAVSEDGIVKVRAEGCTINELFDLDTPVTGKFAVLGGSVNEDQGTTSWTRAATTSTLQQALDAMVELDDSCWDGLRLEGLTPEAQAEVEAYRDRLSHAALAEVAF